MCLPLPQPNMSAVRAESATSAAPPSASPPTPSGSSVLVARFTPPKGSHPPVEPSLTKAVKYCALEGASAVLDIAHTVLARGSVAEAVVAGAHAALNVAAAARCVVRHEAEQVKQGEVQNKSADCARDGAIPLLKADGTVICASP